MPLFSMHSMQLSGTCLTSIRQQIIALLRQHGEPQSSQVATWLLQQTLGLSQQDLIKAHSSDSSIQLSSSEIEQLSNRINRLLQHEPLAYVLGETEFMGYRFVINPEVLIPRSDTECLVNWIFEYIKQNYSPDVSLNLLDLGTGSGAIIISLGLLLQQAGFHKITKVATDQSVTALKMATENAAFHRQEITFSQGDWFTALHGEEWNLSTFDIIVSNPPYVEPSYQAYQDESLQYEPKEALYAEQEGFADLDKIIQASPAYLNREKGLLVLEHGYRQGAKVQQLLQNNFYAITTHKDLANNPRFTSARLLCSKNK